MIWGGYFPSQYHFQVVLLNSGYVDFVINGPKSDVTLFPNC